MTQVTEGLTTAADGEKVNSEAGFAAALAAKGVEPDADGTPVSSDTSIAAGLETAEPAPARGPNGQFVSKAAQAPVDTPPQGADTSTAVANAVTSDDPAVAAYLAKYNGDLDAAIKGAANAQSLIGKRDEEKTQMAERLAHLEGLVEGLSKSTAAPVVQLSDEQVEETASNLVASQGYAAAATAAANDSLAGDSRVYDSILEQWAIESPIQAQRFDLDFQMWKRQQDAPAPMTRDPWAVQQEAATSMEGTLTALAAERGEAWKAIEQHMLPALDTMPKEIANMLGSNDGDTRLAAARLVADRATLLATQAPAAVQQGQDTDPAMPDSVRRKLLGAGVASAGLRPVTPPEGSEQSLEDSIKEFKAAILGAETTSVASGLTYGK